MTVSEVEAAVNEFLGGAELQSGQKRTILSQSGLVVEGPKYTNWVGGVSGDESVDVTFSGVSSGNQAVLVMRQAKYPSELEGPMFDEFVAGLIGKYGEPTFRKDGYQGAAMIWTYKDGRPAHCEDRASPQCLEPTSAWSNLTSSSEYFDVIVYAAVGKTRGDMPRVTQFKISSTDLVLKIDADIADEAGLQPYLDEQLATSAANAPKPKF